MKQKKKIAFVIGSLSSSGGAERVISTLSNELIDKYEIIIITFVKGTPFYSINDNIKVIPCRETIVTPTSVFESLKLNYQLVKNVSKIIKTEKVDLAIGFITSANIVAVLAAKLNKIPSIISERNNPMIEDVPRFWVILRSLVYPKASKVILQTEGVKKFFTKRIKNDKIAILPNPISSDLSLKRKENATKEKIILTVGRLDANKCHNLILKALKNIDTEDWKLVIVGSGPKEEELNNYIAENNLANKAEIVGKIKQIDSYYNKAGIFVFTSRTEGFPNVLLEALHFGIPAISTDCNFGPSEIIENGENGYLIPMNDQGELEDKLTRLIKNKELREKFSKNAKISTKKFQSNAVVEQWDKVIESLI